MKTKKVKKIKLFFWIISFLIMLCVGVVLVATNLVDPNDYKPRLEQLVQSNTGRQLNLKGDLSLTFYPWIGISTGALELSNGEGFGDTPMLSVERANIKIKLLPLLRKKFEIGAIILNKPKIKLVTLANGSTNWDDLLGSWKRTETSQREYSVKDDAQDHAKDDILGIAGLAVQGVSLVDGEIVWDNRNDGQLITISDLHLSIGEMQPDTPLDIELSARIAGNIMPMPAEIDLSSRIIVDEKLNLIKIDKTSVDMTMGTQRYELALALTMDITQQSIAVPAFALTLDELRMNGLFNISNVFSSPTLSGQLNINTSNLGADFEKMRSQKNIELEQDELKQGKLRFEKAMLKTAFNYLNNRVEINSLTAEMEINGQDTKIDIPFASLDVLRQKLKVPALHIQQGGLEINANLIGDALFSGAESVDLAGSLKLHIADLPDFLEDNQLGDILPASLIKTVASEMDYALNEGNLLLSRMKTFADETTSEGSIILNGVIGNKLVGTVKQNIQNINIGKFLTAWDITDMLAGTGAVNLNLTGIDLRAEKPLLNMGGQIEFNLQDGAIRGFDLQAALIKLDNTLNMVTGKQQTQYQTKADAQTKFFELSGAFKGVNGRFQTNNIFMQAPSLRVKGRGSLDLPDQVIDMKFDVSIIKPVQGQGDRLPVLGLENLESLTIPLTISGNLTAPSYGLDVGGLLKQTVKKEIREIKKTVTEKLLKLLGG